jgi:hypothetical protein
VRRLCAQLLAKGEARARDDKALVRARHRQFERRARSKWAQGARDSLSLDGVSAPLNDTTVA